MRVGVFGVGSLGKQRTWDVIKRQLSHWQKGGGWDEGLSREDGRGILRIKGTFAETSCSSGCRCELLSLLGLTQALGGVGVPIR